MHPNAPHHNPSDPAFHPDVGAYSFEYAHRTPTSTTRYTFTMRAGDDPNWWLAKRLMPGAQLMGRIHAVFTPGGEKDDGAVVCNATNERPFNCELRVCDSVFRTTIYAKDGSDLHDRLRQIGALTWCRFKTPPLYSKLFLFLRYYWLRRPCIRRRSPLDIFNTPLTP